MAKVKSKSARILRLYDGKRTTQQIADIVGCRQEYVRVVARQRKGGTSAIDTRYRRSNIAAIRKNHRERRKERYHSDPTYRAIENARIQRWKEENREKVRKAQNAWRARHRAANQEVRAT